MRDKSVCERFNVHSSVKKTILIMFLFKCISNVFVSYIILSPFHLHMNAGSVLKGNAYEFKYWLKYCKCATLFFYQFQLLPKHS